MNCQKFFIESELILTTGRGSCRGTTVVLNNISDNDFSCLCVLLCRVTTWCLWLSFSGGLKWLSLRLCSPESLTQTVLNNLLIISTDVNFIMLILIINPRLIHFCGPAACEPVSSSRNMAPVSSPVKQKYIDRPNSPENIPAEGKLFM